MLRLGALQQMRICTEDGRRLGHVFHMRTEEKPLGFSMVSEPTPGGAVAPAPSPARAIRRGGGYLVCVTNEHSGDISLIDGQSQQVVATIRVGKRPRGIHASPDGKQIYVALSGTPDRNWNPSAEPRPAGEGARKSGNGATGDSATARGADGIGVIDLASHKVLRLLPCGKDPEEFAVSPDGKQLYVSNEDTARLSIVDVATGTVLDTVAVDTEPEGVRVTPDGRFVYVTCETNGVVAVIDRGTHHRVASIAVGGRPRTVVFSPDGARAFVPSETEAVVRVVDTAQHQVLQTIALPENSRPMGMAMARDGAALYVSCGRAGTVCVVDPLRNEVRGTITVGKRPWGIALSPDGARLFVANGPSNDVSIVDLQSQKEIALVPVGSGPWGVAVVATSSHRKESGS